MNSQHEMNGVNGECIPKSQAPVSHSVIPSHAARHLLNTVVPLQHTGSYRAVQ